MTLSVKWSLTASVPGVRVAVVIMGKADCWRVSRARHHAKQFAFIFSLNLYQALWGWLILFANEETAQRPLNKVTEMKISELPKSRFNNRLHGRQRSPEMRLTHSAFSTTPDWFIRLYPKLE